MERQGENEGRAGAERREGQGAYYVKKLNDAMMKRGTPYRRKIRRDPEPQMEADLPGAEHENHERQRPEERDQELDKDMKEVERLLDKHEAIENAINRSRKNFVTLAKKLKEVDQLDAVHKAALDKAETELSHRIEGLPTDEERDRIDNAVTEVTEVVGHILRDNNKKLAEQDGQIKELKDELLKQSRKMNDSPLASDLFLQYEDTVKEIDKYLIEINEKITKTNTEKKYLVDPHNLANQRSSRVFA